MRFYYVTNIFDLHIFDNKTTVLSTFFEICKEMNFVSFFLNEGNIVISRLMVHLKCTAAAHYTNLEFKLHKQAVFKLRAVEYVISFFSISKLCLF